VVSFPLKEDRVQCLAWSPDGKTLVAGSFNGNVKLWDIPARKERAELKGHRNAVAGVSLNSDGTLLATGSWDGTVRLWHMTGERELALLDNKTVLGIWGVACVAFSPNDQHLALGKGTRLFVLDVRQVLDRFPSKK
jgi:WD40 repeat protein